MEESMNIINRLTSSHGRKDEAPNLELAKQIAETNDQEAVSALVENLSKKNKAIQSNCIKVLYEIGGLKPLLIAGFIDELVALLHSKNNRLQWGAMTALSCITRVKPDEIYNNLSQILEAAEKGSVITRDNAVNILIALGGVPKYTKDAFSLLMEQLLKSPTNQLPMYAERISPIIGTENKAAFIEILNARLDDIEKESKRKRVEKVIKKISK